MNPYQPPGENLIDLVEDQGDGRLAPWVQIILIPIVILGAAACLLAAALVIGVSIYAVAGSI